jgi:hypothetical protein
MPAARQACQRAHFRCEHITQKRLLDDLNLSCSGVATELRGGIRGDQQSWRRYALSTQMCDNLQPRHAGQTLIDDEARRAGRLGRGQRRGRIAERRHLIALSFESKTQRAENGSIILNEDEQRSGWAGLRRGFRHLASKV